MKGLPVFLSSSFIKAILPLAVIFILPLHAGSSSFQSAALREKGEIHLIFSNKSLSILLTRMTKLSTRSKMFIFIQTLNHIAAMDFFITASAKSSVYGRQR